MKVLFLNTNIGYGGASKMMTWLANSFSREGHSVTFITYRDSAENQLIDKRVNHIHIQTEDAIKGLRGFYKTIKTIRIHIKEGKYDWAIAFLSPSQLRLSISCIGLPVKLLYSHRGDPYQKPKGVINATVNMCNDWAFSRADYFVFQTERAQHYYPNRIKRRSTVIANPIVPLLRTCLRDGNVNNSIVNVARLDINQKRQDLLIKAFMKISSQFPEYRLLLYGDGEDEQRLKELAGQNKQIVFKGLTNNVVESIQNAMCFVLSSDFEGIPNALLEAMSIGVPCISTDCSPGGAAMLIRNGENGMLVPCGDIDALADALLFFINNNDERERIGRQGMEVCDLYSEERVFSKWEEVIKRSK